MVPPEWIAKDRSIDRRSWGRDQPRDLVPLDGTPAPVR
jgi:hypothetical protein